MNMSIGIVLANSLLLVPVAFLAIILFKAARNGFRRYGVITRSSEMLTCSIDNDCPPEHICIKGRCIPESKLEELIESMA